MQKTRSGTPLNGLVPAPAALKIERQLIKVLLISGDHKITYLIRRAMTEAGAGAFSLEYTDRLATGIECLARGDVDVLLLDPSVPDSRDILDSLAWGRARSAGVPVIWLSPSDDETGEIAALEKGAQEYLPRAMVGSRLIHSIYRAITRQQLMAEKEERARKSEAGEAHLQNIIKSNPDGMIIVDDKGIVRFVNPAAASLFSCKAEQLLGESLDFLPTVEDGKTELSIIRSDGERGTVEIRVARLKYQGEAAYLASMRDITERKRAEEDGEKAKTASQEAIAKANEEVRLAREQAGKIKAASQEAITTASEEAKQAREKAGKAARASQEARDKAEEEIRLAREAAEIVKTASQAAVVKASEEARLAREEAEKVKRTAQTATNKASEEARLAREQAEKARVESQEAATKAREEASLAGEEAEQIKIASHEAVAKAREETMLAKAEAEKAKAESHEAITKANEEARFAREEAEQVKTAAQETAAKARAEVRFAKEETDRAIKASHEAISQAEEETRLAREEAEQAVIAARAAADKAREEARMARKEAEKVKKASQEAVTKAREEANLAGEEAEQIKIAAREAVTKAEEEARLAKAEAEKVKAASQKAVTKANEEARLAKEEAEQVKTTSQKSATKAEEEAGFARGESEKVKAASQEAVAKANEQARLAREEAEQVKATSQKSVTKANGEARLAREEAEQSKIAAQKSATKAEEEARLAREEAEKIKAAAEETIARASEEARLARAARQAAEEATAMAKEELQNLDPMQSEFMANIVHELRAPVHSMLAFTKLIQEGKVPDRETQHEFLNIIGSQGEHLRKLVDELVDISPVKSGFFELRKEEVAIAELLQSAAREFYSVAEQQHVTIQEDLPATLPKMTVDGQRVKQVMFNLLGNAIKFSRDGGSISVRAETRNGALLVAVADQGIGISEEVMPLLFQKFYQAKNTARVGGLGLGLYISKRIIEAHGGQIWAESREGAGSTFSFTLPLS